MKTKEIGLTEKQQSRESFKTWFERYRNEYGLASWIYYNFGLSHDGFTFWNEKSNAIGSDEIQLIKDFCETNRYSFSLFAVKTESPSFYGGIAVEISICQ